MGLFGNLTDEGLEKSEDRVGGGYQPKDTDIYHATCMMAYALKSAQGAQGVFLEFKFDDGSTYRETVYVTNKKGENFFLNKDDTSKKVKLPGYVVMNDLCLVMTDKPLAQQDDEEKVVKIYDFETRSDVPKSVPVLVELLGKTVFLAIGNTLENKSKKEGDKYVPTADERNVNNIEKVFHDPTMLTTTEAENGKTEGEFHKSWLERNKGVVRDKRTIKDGQGGTTGRPGGATASSGPPSAGAAAPRQSLFGQKS